MSGFGERFRVRGFEVPKPLIPVAGRPIIEHVLEMYPTDVDVLFIVNEEHLSNPNYDLEGTLKRLRPNAKVHAIAPHKTGPSGAIYQASSSIHGDAPVIVNYCDFGCLWDFDGFLSLLQKSDGVIATYSGFHPHMIRSTKFAYAQCEGNRVLKIREKNAFTKFPMSEPASSGTYGFRSGQLLIGAINEQIEQGFDLDGELYTSLTYLPLLARGLDVRVFPIDRFFQWGTPEDLEDFIGAYKVFEEIASYQESTESDASIVLLAGGLGKRFTEACYTTPKASMSISGRPAWEQIINSMQTIGPKIIVAREGTISVEGAETTVTYLELEKLSEGQAATAHIGLEALPDLPVPVLVASCDAVFPCGVKMLKWPSSDPDLLVWTARSFPKAGATPEQYAWVKVGTTGIIEDFRMKKAPDSEGDWQVVTGTFMFKDRKTALKYVEHLEGHNIRTNGEIYLDNAITVANSDNKLALAVLRQDFIGIGTPEEYESFRYWQGAFHRWEHSAYNISKDSSVHSRSIPNLINGAFEKIDTPLGKAQ
jgi:NDP-sugar pyrophosphorylase family protein